MKDIGQPDWRIDGVKVIKSDRLEFVAEADAGDFIFVPPHVPHQEINRSSDSPLECVLVRSDNEAVVVNLNIDAAERVEEVYWVDPIHGSVAK